MLTVYIFGQVIGTGSNTVNFSLVREMHGKTSCNWVTLDKELEWFTESTYQDIFWEVEHAWIAKTQKTLKECFTGENTMIAKYNIPAQLPNNLTYEGVQFSELLKEPAYHIGQKVYEINENDEPEYWQEYYVIGIRIDMYVDPNVNTKTMLYKPKWLYLLHASLKSAAKPYTGWYELSEDELASELEFIEIVQDYNRSQAEPIDYI